MASSGCCSLKSCVLQLQLDVLLVACPVCYCVFTRPQVMASFDVYHGFLDCLFGV